MPPTRLGALVLARGLGTRMRAADPGAALSAAQREAADAGVKAMMPVNGRPFLDYLLSALADAGVARAGLVVAPEHEPLRRYYSGIGRPARIDVEFVVQPEALGTAHAVLAGESWAAGDPFLTMNADNLYPVDALADLAALDEPGLPAFDAGDLVASSNIPAERVAAFAVIETNEQGYLTRIVEKPEHASHPTHPLVSMNCWRFDERIFSACRDVPRSPRGEFELPAAVMLAMQRGVRFKAIPARGPVLDLSRRGDAADVEQRLAGKDARP